MGSEGNQLIILGAGRPHRGVVPTSLIELGEDKKSFLKWQLDSFSGVIFDEIYSIVGFESEKQLVLQNELNLVFNPYWESRGSAFSLFCLPESVFNFKGRTWIIYADVLFRKENLSSMASVKSSWQIGIDSLGENRTQSRTKDEWINGTEKVFYNGSELTFIKGIQESNCIGELIGPFVFSEKYFKDIYKLKNVVLENEKMGFTDLLNCLFKEKSNIDKELIFDHKGKCAEYNAPEDLARFILGTKAESLIRLRSLVENSNIPQSLTILRDDWINQKNKEIDRILNSMKNEELIAVRSSFRAEDTFEESMAGNFESLLNVSMETSSVKNAVETVFSCNPHPSSRDEVLIQPMVKNVQFSGVILTCTFERQPYIVVNYSNGSDTDLVTGGKSNSNETHLYYFLKSVSSQDERLSKGFRNLLSSVEELEYLVGHKELDIEFCVDKNGQIWVLQVRPMVQKSKTSIGEKIEEVFEDVKSIKNISGRGLVLSNMADWNPAEMIGNRPNPLALSLYETLITNKIWARQRYELGNLDLRGIPLMHEIFGRPYIDVVSSLTSFIPREALSNEKVEKLLEYSLNKLKSNPALHDKIEFELIPTCFDPSYNIWSEKIGKSILMEEEGNYREKLKENTEKILKEVSRLKSKIKEFEIELSELNSQNDLLQKMFLTLELGKKSALNFAHLARLGFIAKSWFNSFLKLELISEEELNKSLLKISSVSTEMSKLLDDMRKGKLEPKKFMERFGHLRSGTYNLDVPNYKKIGEKILLASTGEKHSDHEVISEVTLPESFEIKLSAVLRDLNWSWSPTEFINLLRECIALRELGKFEYSKVVNAILEQCEEVAIAIGFDLEDFKYLTISEIIELLRSPTPSRIKWFKETIKRKQIYDKKLDSFVIPPFIDDLKNIDQFEWPQVLPNFVMKSVVVGDIVIVSPHDELKELDDKIVLIESADPGMDWIFSANIKGLITMYGGANSHMSIRCYEYNIPAAIGVGEKIFQKLKGEKELILDCYQGKILNSIGGEFTNA